LLCLCVSVYEWCSQSAVVTASHLNRWRRNGDVCENYMPHKVAPTCTGMPFYHWGALTGFLSLLDAGLYE